MPSSESQEASLDELRATVARLEEENAALRRTRLLLRGIANHAPAVIYIKDRHGRFILSNELHATLLGLTPTEVIGKQESDLLPPEVAADIDSVTATMFESGAPQSTVFGIEISGKPRIFLELMFPIRDEQGEIIALGGIANDITETRRTEERNAALQAEIIESQRRVIRELSVPLLPLADGVVVLPLLGVITIDRAEQIARSVLERVHTDGIHTILFDTTGMPDCDDAAVAEFARLLRALHLLGARTLLTGITPTLAKRLLPMASMLRAVETVSTVQAGVALALKTAQTRP